MTRPTPRDATCPSPPAPRASAFAALCVILAAAPLAFGQTTPKHKKKKATPPAAATASEATPPPPAPDEAAAKPEPAPAATTPEPPPPPPPPVAAPPNNPPSGEPITNTTEDPNKRYIFIGLRYRGTVIPQFLENLFVNEGATLYSNSIGAEVDIRKGGQSTIPWIQYTDYNTGDVLFLQKGQDANDAAYYSVVNSSLKAIYVGLDELWSVPVANHLDFEFGFGVGIGFLFGDLGNNWVYRNDTGSLVDSSNRHYAACPSQNGQRGCNESDHQNATIAKVGGYVEPNWFNGGAVPVIFPHVSIPQLSLRYKPIKSLETRLGIGFSLTGFWFGLSADYGLEHTDNATTAPRATNTTLRDHDESL